MLGAYIALHEVSFSRAFLPNGLSNNHALEKLLMHLLRSLVVSRGNEGSGIV